MSQNPVKSGAESTLDTRHLNRIGSLKAFLELSRAIIIFEISISPRPAMRCHIQVKLGRRTAC